MKVENLVKVGIAAGEHWPGVDFKTKLLIVDDETTGQEVVLAIETSPVDAQTAAQWSERAEETIQMEHLTVRGEHLRVGYGPITDVLVIALSDPDGE